MPLDEHIEGGHGEREARLKIRPAPMHLLFEMADADSIELRGNALSPSRFY